jgi:hypothetical protein
LTEKVPLFLFRRPCSDRSYWHSELLTIIIRSQLLPFLHLFIVLILRFTHARPPQNPDPRISDQADTPGESPWPYTQPTPGTWCYYPPLALDTTTAYIYMHAYPISCTSVFFHRNWNLAGLCQRERFLHPIADFEVCAAFIPEPKCSSERQRSIFTVLGFVARALSCMSIPIQHVHESPSFNSPQAKALTPPFANPVEPCLVIMHAGRLS